MIGLEKTWLSRTIAKCWENWDAELASSEPVSGAVALPRSAIFLVTSWNACWPSPEKSKVTFGWFVVGSKPCCGLLISDPFNAGWSLSTNCGEFESSCWERVNEGLVGAAATRVPWGTDLITDPAGCLPFLNGSSRSLCFSAGPESSLCDFLSNR